MKRNHADNSEKGDCFEILFDYLKILELEEEDMLNMKVIHVAGTKGKVDVAILEVGLGGRLDSTNSLGVPAFTVPQPDEAMRLLEEKASQLNCILPEKFIKGLATASLQGRGQVVSDQFIESQTSGDLVFYLDGAHTPESMEVCAKWFSSAVNRDNQSESSEHLLSGSSESSHDQFSGEENCHQILLFNCMSVRDPTMLLPHLRNTCSNYGVHFKKALFVPNMSVYHKVGTAADLPEDDPQVDLSWQLTLQKVWESLVQSEIGEEDGESSGNSEVYTSLPMAIKWLRDSVHESSSATRFQV
uniref:Folylpolyglutamate synthase n=1 Tax=Brassica campestris TaxID=3711 RepID=M4CNT3_BRACM